MSEELFQKQLSAQELWVEAVRKPRPHKVVDFPRVDPETKQPIASVALVFLSQRDNADASASALKKAQKLLKEESGKPPPLEEVQRSEVYSLTSSVELLFRACKDPSDATLQKPFFKKAQDIEEYLTPQEIAVLVVAYQTMCATLGPIRGAMDSDDEMEGYLATMAYGGNFDPLHSASQVLLIQCVTYLASRLYASPTSKSLLGSRPDSGENLTPNDMSSDTSLSKTE